MKVSDLRQIIQSLPDDLEITASGYDLNGHSFNRRFLGYAEDGSIKLDKPVLDLHIEEEEDEQI